MITKKDLQPKSKEEIEAGYKNQIIKSIYSSHIWTSDELNLLFNKYKTELNITKDLFNDAILMSGYSYITKPITKLEKIFKDKLINLDIISTAKDYIQDAPGYRNNPLYLEIEAEQTLLEEIYKVKQEYQNLCQQASGINHKRMDELTEQITSINNELKHIRLMTYSNNINILNPLLEEKKLF